MAAGKFMPYALLQKSLDAPSAEQLRTAYREVPDVTAVDADRLCQNMFGILARSLRPDQAAALQAGLKAQGIETEVLDESALPPLPPGKVVRRLEFTTETLMVFDALGRAVPVPWEDLMLLAAGNIQQATFPRTRTEREEVRTKFVHGVIPIQVREIKVGYSSQESAQKVLRGEIILTRAATRYTIEGENFNYVACLGEHACKDISADFCLIMRELARRAPEAALGRGVAALLAEPPGLVAYPRHKSLEEEMVWMLWQMASGSQNEESNTN